MYMETHDHDEIIDPNSASDRMQPEEREASNFDFKLIKVGLPTYVDHYSRGVQRHPQALAHNGSYIVAWTDDVLPHCEIGGPDIRAKYLASDASPIADAFKVNTETIDHQRDPALAVLSSGGMVIAWQDFSGRGGDPCSGAIKAKIFDEQSANIRGEFLLNSTTEGRQSKVALAPLSTGGFVAAWLCESSGRNALRAQTFDGRGERVGDEKTVCSHSAPIRAKVCALPDGGFAVLFMERPQQAGETQHHTKLFVSHSGNDEVIETKLLFSARASATGSLALAASTDGSLVSMWIEAGQSDRGILMAAFVDAAGVSSEPVVVAEACDLRAQITVTSSDDGLFLTAMTETVGELKIVRVIAFDPPHRVIRNDTVLHRSHAHCASPAVVTLGRNEHMVVWEAGDTNDGEDWIWIKAQRFCFE